MHKLSRERAVEILTDSDCWVDGKQVSLEKLHAAMEQYHREACAQGAELAAILPGTYYMDPPDGGDVSVLEQVRRMAQDAARYRWLRDPANQQHEDDVCVSDSTFNVYFGDDLDAAIDAARGGA